MRYQLVAIAAVATSVYAAAPQPASYGAASPAYPEHVPTYPSGKNETAQHYPDNKGDGSYWHDDESDYAHPPKYCPEEHESDHYGPAEPYKCPGDEGYDHDDKHDEAPHPAPYPEKGDDKDDAPKPPVYEPKPEHDSEDKEDDYTKPPQYCPNDAEKPEHYGPAEPYPGPDDKDEHVPVYPEQPKAPEYKPEEPKQVSPEAPTYEQKPEEPKPQTPSAPTQPAVYEPIIPTTVTPVPMPRPTGGNATEPRPTVVAYTGGAPATGALAGLGAIIAGFAAFLL